MKTALVYHPVYLRHYTGPSHPERASRLQAILRKLRTTHLIDDLQLFEPKAASLDDIALVHSRDYIVSVKALAKDGFANLDPETVVSSGSFEAALYAAGGVIKGIDLVLKGETDNAFAMVRPPGHHALPSRAMGFCVFNNIAIGAKYIQKNYKYERILIVDFDIHHGNGTEEIFYEDPGVFYISLHQYPHYPGTGAREDIGRGRGKGFNLNLPMSPGSGDVEYIKVFKDTVIPAANSFKPQVILISAGFDGHAKDPLSSTTLTSKGYYEITTILKELAKSYSENRIVSILEGGYNLFSLADSVHSHLKALMA
jgi:acetoin utilization deacetylase AcuC-like enzyme